MKLFLLFLLSVASLSSFSQDSLMEQRKHVFFPHKMHKSWQTSIGFTSTTMPLEITEEAHFRVPAGDFHVLRKLPGSFYLDGRINFQILQNLVSLGPRWTTRLSHRLSMGLGNDVAFWFGRINVGGIRTRGQGFQDYPNIAFGYHFNKQILLTVRAESLLTFGVQTYAGNTPVKSNYRFSSGSAYSIILEQPFAGNKGITLGFRAIYTDYFWQTWTLFENYDRKLFFPQIIVGLIL